LSPLFSRYTHTDVRRVIEEYPLAWVLSPGAPAPNATLLPMLGVFGDDGALVGLFGHMSRANPLHARLVAQGVAQFLFTGPQGYVSPEHAGRRNWGPTWNYAAVRIEAEVRMDTALTEGAVKRLIAANEAGRARPWTADELGERYRGMLGAIIGFEARVTALDATFKLAQDEDDEVLGHLVEAHPDADLRAWMRRMNEDRLG